MKVTRTITIDPDINTELKNKPHINVSGLINDLLKKWLRENQDE